MTQDFSRRRFFTVAAATLAAGPLGLAGLSRRVEAMAQAVTEAGANIRPFKVTFPNEDVMDLRKRVKATRWPDKETVNDETQGVRLATMQKLAQYWANEHDWSKCEAKLNSLSNHITEIDGLDIHFIHARSKHENALPMIVTHG